MINPIRKQFVFLSWLALILFVSGLTTVSAQKDTKPAQDSAKPASSPKDTPTVETTEEEDEEPSLSKIEEMPIPSVEELLKKPPVDWIVMENDYVLIVEPIYPRPDTLKQLDAALKESYNWPKPRSKEEIDEQRQMRMAMNFVHLTLVNEKRKP